MGAAPDGRLALITGASRGIGRALALALAGRGWRIVAVARSAKALESLDDEIRALGGEATLAPLDLKDGDALDRLGAALFERFGRLDGLGACAGVLGELTPVFQARPSMLEEVIGVNLVANARLIRAMHPLLRLSPAGRAVFLSSGTVKRVRGFWGAYAASKAGLDALVRTYALDCAPSGLKVNLADPGPTRTAMRAKAYPGEDPNTLPAPAEIAPALADLLGEAFEGHGLRLTYDRTAGRFIPDSQS